MKILVTGGLGNVGSSTLTALSKHHQVSCFDLPTKKNLKRAKTITGINYIWGNITNKPTVTTAVSDHDLIVHLAAILPPTSDDNPALTQPSMLRAPKT